jgi:hypothetical protein
MSVTVWSLWVGYRLGGPTLRAMSVEFLTDDQAAAYGRYAGAPSRADLERVFFLDDEDRALVERHRGEHMKLGFSLQLVTVRWVGTFLEDPLDVPGVVLDFVAEQLGIADASQVKKYTERPKTRFDHQASGRSAGPTGWPTSPCARRVPRWTNPATVRWRCWRTSQSGAVSLHGAELQGVIVGQLVQLQTVQMREEQNERVSFTIGEPMQHD